MNTAAPAAGINSAGIGSGAVILGLLLVAWLAGRWKNIPSESRKLVGIVAIAVIFLAGAGGIIGNLFNGARQAGDGIGQTVTGTTTGR
ncbi:hypothetical protein [Streptomyces sp.]|uniref:hypothetical protein n=1 Tax=Streptomyces sp. TaxID=1931 RepID=UPI002F950C31